MSSRITQFLRAHLAAEGRLSLPGFGIVSFDRALASDVSPGAADGFPPGSLSFLPDRRTRWDEELIESIGRDTGKMRTLVLSDLDSYLQFGHELTNISKPFHLEGIGWVQKDHRGDVSFMQEDGTEGAASAKGRRGARKTTLSIPWPSALPWAGATALAAAAVWAWAHFGLTDRLRAWQAARKTAEQPAVKQAPPSPSVDTPAKPRKDSFPFYVVLEVSSRNRALKRYADLREWGHDVRMSTRDSLSFKLYLPIQAPLADTARHRDSLRLFFNRRVWIETKPDE
jgi:hypothetical protein